MLSNYNLDNNQYYIIFLCLTLNKAPPAHKERGGEGITIRL